jgi:membrane protease YdiL (CAAX protease family)
VEKISTSDRSPLSPTRSPDAGFVWWQSLLFAVVLFLALVIPSVFVLVFMIVGGWVHEADLRKFSWQVLVGQLVAYACALALIFPVLPMIARRSWAALGLRAPRLLDAGYGIVGAFVMVAVTLATGAAQDAIFHLKPDEVQVQWLRAARGPLIGMFVVLACAAAPFFEELTFRGFVFNAFRRYMPLWGAVTLSAIVFGLSHWQPGNGGAIAPLIAGGIVLAVVYARSGSLVASMITHASFNLVTVVAVLAFHQG